MPPLTRLAALVLVLAACSSGEAPPAPGDGPGGADTPPVVAASEPDPADWERAQTAGGRLTVAWRADHGAITRNQETGLEVLVLSGGRPVSGARLVLRGDMPAHGHGLVRAPRVRDLGGGRFRVDGLLLHMRGHWVLWFDVTDDQGVATATFELDL